MRTRKDPKRLVTLTAEEEKHLFRYPKGGTYTNISIETIQKAEIQNYQWEKLSKTRMSSDFTNRLYQAILDSDRETPETKKIIVPDSFFKIGQEE